MDRKTIKIREKERKIEIIRGQNCLDSIKDIFKKYNGLYIITNDKVWSLWGEKIKAVLDNSFFLYILPDGERYKNLKSVERMYDFLSKNKATRNSCIIAFGGGVVGDLAGFCASTYHRGMRLIHIPTTLLSMVDSSIGGKTGFNLKTGKNLVGTFYQPDYIISDTKFLDTLPDKEFFSGLAEIIKAGLIADSKLFFLIESRKEDILRREENILDKIIFAAQDIKIKVIKKDEKESNLRAILNFGHTFGHAVEKLSKWRMMHGYAIAKGIAFESYLSYKVGYLSFEKYLRIISLVKSYGYPIKFKFNPCVLRKTFFYDKKRKDNDVEWVLLKNIGKASYGEKIKDDLLQDALNDYNKDLDKVRRSFRIL